MLLDERNLGHACVRGRMFACSEPYLSVSNFVRMHVVTVLTAVDRVADKRARRIGMMTTFFGRVNGTQ
eukprot:3834501-Prymnesium_polylepis.1